MDEQDHRAERLMDDLLDQHESMLGALAEAHERDVRPLAGRDDSDLVDVDLARDHLMPEVRHDRRYESQPIAPLVRDQHAEVLCFPVAHSLFKYPFQGLAPHLLRWACVRL